MPAIPEHLCEERPRLIEPADAEDLLRVGADAAHPSEVVGERFAERRCAGAVAVAEFLGRHRPDRLRRGPDPLGSREVLKVGCSGLEVVAELLGRLDDVGRDHRRGGCRKLRDPRRRALPQREITLGSELGVGLHHQRPRNPEIGREIAGRGDRRTGPQSAGPYGVADLPLDLRLQGFRAVPLDGEEDFGFATGQLFLRELVIIGMSSLP